MQYYIYKITNNVNGKCYIGQHKVPNHPENFRRYLGTGIAIREAIKKYGKDAFRKEILEYIDDDEKHTKVSEREIYYIKMYNSRVPNGYNISPGGEGGATKESGRKSALTRKLRGYKMTDETKRKILVANVGKPKSSTHKKHLSDHHHLKTRHTIIYEKSDKVEYTYDSVRTIAKRYGIAERSLIRASMKNVFICGIKLPEFYDPVFELYDIIDKYGVFIDPVSKKLKTYQSMLKTLIYHQKRDHLYSNYSIWDLLYSITTVNNTHKGHTININQLKHSKLYKQLLRFQPK